MVFDRKEFYFVFEEGVFLFRKLNYNIINFIFYFGVIYIKIKNLVF